MKRILLALVLLFVAGYTVQAEVATGTAAPDFTLTDTRGKAHTLSSYKGKIVVLEWFNPDCPCVKKHYQSGNMQTLQKEYTEKGVLWFGIDSSAPGKEGNYPPAGINDWAKKEHAFSTAFLLDGDGKVGKLYDAKTTPHLFIIDPKGILIYQGAIDSIPSTDPADIAKAQNYVRTALSEFMAGKPVTTPATKSYGCSVKY